MGKWREREKNNKSVVCVVPCKKLLSTTIIDLPTANMRRTYEGIGVCVDD
jgi:hypothetical protein